MALLDLIGVSKAYESKKILDEIDFSIAEGERVALIAKNGGGKSTLMKICRGCSTSTMGGVSCKTVSKWRCSTRTRSLKRG